VSLDGVRGMSPVAQCRTALGLNENLRESSHQFFEQGSRPSGVLLAPPGVTETALNRLEERRRRSRCPHSAAEMMQM
jgi:phage portal protein BeeE